MQKLVSTVASLSGLACMFVSLDASAAWTKLQRQGVCHAMHFVDNSTGFAIHGGSGLQGNSLQKWNGTQWQGITATGWTKGTLSGQLRLFFVDANVGFSAVNASPLTAFLQKTSNAGVNWTNKAIVVTNPPPSPEAKVEGISFANAQDGVAIGWISQAFNPTNGQTLVAVTHDGGEAWAPIPAPSDAGYLYGGAMLGTNHIVVYGYASGVTDGGIWITRNGGGTWTKARPGNRPVAMDFLSTTVGYAWITCAGPGQGALDKCLSKTTNGGDTWTDIQTGYVVDNVAQMKFADENNGIITTGKTVYETTNGGTTWTEDPLPDVLGGNTSCVAYPGPGAFIGVTNGNDFWYADDAHGGGPKANLPGAPPSGTPDAGTDGGSSSGGSSGGGSSSGGSSGETSSGAASSSSGGAAASTGEPSASAAPSEDDGGCSTTGAGSTGLSTALLAAIASAAVVLRRRPGRRPRRRG